MSRSILWMHDVTKPTAEDSRPLCCRSDLRAECQRLMRNGTGGACC